MSAKMFQNMKNICYCCNLYWDTVVVYFGYRLDIFCFRETKNYIYKSNIFKSWIISQCRSGEGQSSITQSKLWEAELSENTVYHPPALRGAITVLNNQIDK